MSRFRIVDVAAEADHVAVLRAWEWDGWRPTGNPLVLRPASGVVRRYTLELIGPMMGEPSMPRGVTPVSADLRDDARSRI
jgi:hypothetical protein